MPIMIMIASTSHLGTIVTLLMILLQQSIAQVLIIDTSSGPINGVLKDLDGEKYRMFLGIPYAEQPERFRPAIPTSPQTSTLQAMEYGPSCPQDVVNIDQVYDRDYLFDVPESAKEISEDCLTLNIFTPDEVNPTDERFAVMVWIHGGDFEVGQGAAYDGGALTTRGRVVVVTLNYRLGPFGFLSTLDQHSTGNYGLLDQQLALRWVQKNIAKFGGDPERVTLFGQSTGGISASLHMFAPRSQELFHRVIAESSVTTPWNLDEGFREPSAVAQEFGTIAGCPDDNAELMECLRNAPLTNLMDAWRVVQKQPWRVTWGPVIDGAFLPMPSVYTGVSEDRFMVMDHDLLVGVNTLEGSLKQITELNGINGDLNSGLSSQQWNTVVDSILADFGDRRSLVSSSVNQLYTDWNMYRDDLARLNQALSLIGDMDSVIKVYDFLTSWTSGKAASGVFMYVFDHKTKSGGMSSISGAPRNEEIPYVWGAPFSAELMGNFTDEEKELSDTVMMYWTNFAKSGDPNDNPDQPVSASAINGLPNWPEYTPDMTYLNLAASNGTGGTSARQGYRWQFIYFWTETLPSQLEQSECSQQDANDKCKVGEKEGWNLTPRDAVVLLNIFLAFCISLVCILLMTCAGACGYREAVRRAKYGGPKGNLGYLPRNKSAYNDLWKVNDAFEPDSEEETNTHL